MQDICQIHINAGFKQVIYIWRAIDQHVQVSCGLSYKEEILTTLYEDNAACIASLLGEYISSEVFLHA